MIDVASDDYAPVIQERTENTRKINDIQGTYKHVCADSSSCGLLMIIDVIIV